MSTSLSLSRLFTANPVRKSHWLEIYWRAGECGPGRGHRPSVLHTILSDVKCGEQGVVVVFIPISEISPLLYNSIVQR